MFGDPAVEAKRGAPNEPDPFRPFLRGLARLSQQRQQGQAEFIGC
jgi:hypothetical protein